MKIKELKEILEVPNDVECEIDKNILKVKGKLGENKKEITPRIQLKKEDNKIVLIIKDTNKKDKMFIGTFKAHIKNLIKGVREGFNYKLKICYGHFPITVSVDKGFVVVKNFLGEKTPRKSKIIEGVDVKVDGDVITVSGANKECVSQSAANIEVATKIRGRDRRIFQDGIFIIEKDGKKVR